jgi:hypothetical protein
MTEDTIFDMASLTKPLATATAVMRAFALWTGLCRTVIDRGQGVDSVNITYLREFWFGDRVYSDTANHPHYQTVRFADRPNIDAQIWLTIMSPGATFSGGAVTAIGSAAAAVKSYAFVNAQGQIETRDAANWDAHAFVERVVDITFAFHVRLAWAKAEGQIYYWR